MKTSAVVRTTLVILSACLSLTACASASGEPAVAAAASPSEVVPVRIDGSFLGHVELS